MTDSNLYPFIRYYSGVSLLLCYMASTQVCLAFAVQDGMRLLLVSSPTNAPEQ